MHTSQSSVADFLLNLKLILTFGNAQDDRFVFVTREKNKQTLLQLGITENHVRQVILGLTSSDYISGPEKDDDPTNQGAVWKFNKEVQGEKIYIKLNVRDDKAYRCVRCISFHLQGMAQGG